MAKLYLYYKKHGDSVLGNILKIKVDDSIIAEVNKNDIYEVSLRKGKHNIKMYYEGWSKDELIGYVNQEIVVDKDVYYIYKNPIFINGKGRLVEFQCDNQEFFRKHIKHSNILTKALCVTLVLIALIILFII